MSNQLVVKYPIIGWNRYQYNGREALYLNIIEDYPQDDKNVGGSLQTAIAAPYAESAKVLDVAMSLTAPATIEFKGRMQSRAGSVSLVCDEIISVTPFSDKKGNSAANPSTKS